MCALSLSLSFHLIRSLSKHSLGVHIYSALLGGVGHSIDPRVRALHSGRERENSERKKNCQNQSKKRQTSFFPAYKIGLRGNLFSFFGRIWSESLRKKRIRCLRSCQRPKHPSRLSSRRYYSMYVFSSSLCCPFHIPSLSLLLDEI